MASKHDEIIEACARVVDNTAEELRGLILSPASRTSQYDRQTKKQLEAALTWCEKAASRVRDLKSAASATAAAQPADDSLTILSEVRPLLEGGRPSTWRKGMLARIDALLAKR